MISINGSSFNDVAAVTKKHLINHKIGYLDALYKNVEDGTQLAQEVHEKIKF